MININSITLNSPTVNDNQVIRKSYLNQFHQKNERSIPDLGIIFQNESSDLVKIDQDSNFKDNKLKNLNSFTVNRNPSSYNELSNAKYVDDSLSGGNILGVNQTLDNYLKVSVWL